MSDTQTQAAVDDAAEPGTEWTPWVVAPHSGFEVADADGNVGIVQVDEQQFRVINRFRFVDDEVERDIVQNLVKQGVDETAAAARYRAASEFVPPDGDDDEALTDLASIPRFMRWFENPYGLHSLAALIHDVLITDTANSGALGSDTMADRFFRLMMRKSGVPWLKRWIMWAAVAMRTRYAAGGYRRWTLFAWLVVAVVGITSGVWALGAWIFDWSTPFSAGLMAVIAVVLPIVSSRLWGDQWAASLVAAIAAFWVVPAAAVAFVGYAVYLVLERVAKRAGRT